MAIYDNPSPQPPSWTPPGYTTVPSDAQPTTDGDRWAIIALAVAATTLISCIPFVNCLAPLVPLVVGIITLNKAKTAIDPSKARLYGWIATILGGLVLLVVIGAVVAYGALFASLMNNPDFTEQLR